MPYMHHSTHHGGIVGKEAAAFRASIEHAAIEGMTISQQKLENFEIRHHLAHPDVTLEEKPEEEEENPSASITSVKWRRRWKKTANRIPIAACVMNFHRWWLVLLLVGLWTITGLMLLGFEVGENMGVLDAAYVLAQIATTIGYGDVAPQSSDKMKVFLSFHALLGIVVVATVLAAVVQEVLRSSQEVLAKRLQARTQNRFQLDQLPEWEGNLLQTMAGTLYAFGIMMAFLLGGMLFFGTVESCTCGRRDARVEGCEDDRCEETGGYQKSFLDAWYMSCISLTTVGFGDYSPQSGAGRAFAIFWMIFGVVAVANFQFEASKWLMHSDTMSKILNTDLDAVFDDIDRDQNGRLERHEFMVFALLEGGLVERSTLVGIQQLFDELDADKNGTVSREEIQGFFARQRERDAARFAAKPTAASVRVPRSTSRLCEDDPIVVTATGEPQDGVVVGRRVIDTE